MKERSCAPWRTFTFDLAYSVLAVIKLRIILAVIVQFSILNYRNNCSEPMIKDSQNMTMEELVDILAQKTQKYTQLLVYKDFGNEYKECKEAIQHILAEIDLRKETTIPGQSQAASA